MLSGMRQEASISNYAWVSQGTSPMYNLLPDMLSGMSQDASLSEEAFQAIMMHLLTGSEPRRAQAYYLTTTVCV